MEPLDELIRRMETMPCDGSTVAVPLDTWELAHYYLQHMSEADEEMREDLVANEREVTKLTADYLVVAAQLREVAAQLRKRIKMLQSQVVA